MQSNSGTLILLWNTVLKAEKTQIQKTVLAVEHKFSETSCLRQKDCKFSH